MWIPNIRIGVPISPDFFGSHRGHHQGQSFGNFVWRIFCRKTFFGRHTISLVEDLAWQANPLLDFHRAVPAPSHTAGDRVRRRRSLIELLASREMGAADCTVAFRQVHERLKARLKHWQPYAPDGWRGGSGRVRALPEFTWPSSELDCRTRSKQAFLF